MKDKLKPCPFCGSGGDSLVTQRSRNDDYVVHCLNCKADGPVTHYSEEFAEKFWNRRIEEAAK